MDTPNGVRAIVEGAKKLQDILQMKLEGNMLKYLFTHVLTMLRGLDVHDLAAIQDRIHDLKQESQFLSRRIIEHLTSKFNSEVCMQLTFRFYSTYM
jgi:hypothetical protein